MPFPFASPAEIIRADQKDLFYKGLLLEFVSRTFKGFLGSRLIILYQKELAAVCDLLYYGLTTCRTGQTLGEEFCDIQQVQVKSLKVPTRASRLCLILLDTLTPYLYGKLTETLGNLWGSLRARDEREGVDSSAPSRAKNFLRELFSQLKSYHLAFFYLFGSYYHLNKRILGIRFLLLRQPRAGEAPLDYSVLGLLILAQLFLEALNKARQTSWKKMDKQHSVSASSTRQTVGTSFWSKENLRSPAVVPHTNKLAHATPQSVCMLCLELSTNPTSTPCGHIFCWYCVSEWASAKQECPLCRRHVRPNRLVPVYQFA